MFLVRIRWVVGVYGRYGMGQKRYSILEGSEHLMIVYELHA
jgi:hypothetical protein